MMPSQTGRRGGRRLLAVALALHCACGLPAHAQLLQDMGRGAYEVSETGTGAWALGAGKASLVPHVQASWSHDDNLFIDSDVRTRDTSWTVTPGLSYTYGGRGHNHVYAAYAVDVVRYDEQSEQDYENHSVGAGVRLRTNRSFLDTAYNFTRSVGAAREVGDRLQRDAHTAEALLESRVAPKVSAGLRYSWIENRYESDAFVDDTEHRLGARAVYHFSPVTDLYGEAARGWVDLHPAEADFADGTYWEVGGGVRRVLSARTSGSAWVGHQERTFDGDVADVQQWVARAEMGWQATPHAAAGLQVYATLRPSLQLAGETTYSYGVRPSLRSRLLTERLYGTASLEVGAFERIDAAGRKARDDTYWGATLGLDWRVAERVTLGIDGSYIENRSNADAFAFERRQVSVRAAINL